MLCRDQRLSAAQDTTFDVAIIGGGINGACLYDSLCRSGYRTIILDQGDFACGSSQASGMMIWGGLLYLKNLDLASVYRFSRSRDRMIKSISSHILPTHYRYVPGGAAARNQYFVHAALYLYWLIGLFNRKRPVFEPRFTESELLPNMLRGNSLVFEEGFLRESDSRFVLRWISPHQKEWQTALNYCKVNRGDYSKSGKLWNIEATDNQSNTDLTIKAKYIVNCAGVWTDKTNQQFDITTQYKHVFSKGVYISTKRHADHNSPLIFEMGNNGDVLTYVPWGPVSMWGPTETPIRNIEDGYHVHENDIQFLLEKSENLLRKPLQTKDIISFRCGIRPLVVPHTFSEQCYPLELSRGSKFEADHNRPWLSVFGGKISGCVNVADHVSILLAKYIRPSAVKENNKPAPLTAIEWVTHPAIKEKVPSIKWCTENEFCVTLEDYLRRRTNLSQWISNCGIGKHGEYLTWMTKAALQLYAGDKEMTFNAIQSYIRSTKTQHAVLTD